MALMWPRHGVIEPAPVRAASYFSGTELERARDFRRPQVLLGLAAMAVELGLLALLVAPSAATPAGPVPAPDPGRRGGRRSAVGARERRTAAAAGRRAPAGEGCRARDTVLARIRVRSRPVLGHRRGVRRRSAPRSRSASSVACRGRGGSRGRWPSSRSGRSRPTPARSCSTRSSTGSRHCRRGRRAATCSTSPGRPASTSGRSTSWTPASARPRRTPTSTGSGTRSASCSTTTCSTTSAATRRGSSSPTSSGTSATTTCRGG